MDDDNWIDLAVEAGQLREALMSRAPIEQAKGIIVAARRCGPEEAFAKLKKCSNDTNVTLRDLASLVVLYATRGITPETTEGHEPPVAVLIADLWLRHLTGGAGHRIESAADSVDAAG